MIINVFYDAKQDEYDVFLCGKDKNDNKLKLIITLRENGDSFDVIEWYGTYNNAFYKTENSDIKKWDIWKEIEKKIVEKRENLPDDLYDKMLSSQKVYRNELLQKSKEKILDSAYEYCIRENIMLVMEMADLEGEEVRILLAMDDPLSAICRKWMSTDSSSDICQITEIISEIAREERMNDM